jgi:hypothetical protein
MPQALPNRICRTLEPTGVIRCLFGSKYIYKTGTKLAELVSILNMLIKGSTVELSQYPHAVDVAVDAIADGNVNQPVFPGNWNGRLTPAGCKGEQPCSGTTAKDYSQG